ncbi:MAG: cytochrome P450 [Clostridia bacterium]
MTAIRVEKTDTAAWGSVPLLAATQAAALWWNPIGSLIMWRRRYGDPFWMRLPRVGPILVVGEPQVAREVLLSDPDRSAAGVATGRVLPVLGESCILRQDGTEHAQRRRLLRPFFHGTELQGDSRLLTTITGQHLAQWEGVPSLRVLPRFQALAFSIIVALVLGITDTPEVAELRRLVRRASGVWATVGTWVWPFESQTLEAKMWRYQHRLEAEVDAALASLMAIHDRNTRQPPSALERLLAGTGEIEGLRGPALFEELRALLVVGHETTAAALAWATDRLVHEPGIQVRLAESVDDGDTGPLDAFIHEVLRWRPPVVDTVRALHRPMTIAGRPVAPGTLVMVSPLLVHHHPRAYVSAETFQPDRFLHRPPRSGTPWWPFGGGSRRCLGAHLAMEEMRVVLSELLTRFSLSAVDRQPERAHLAGTLMVPAHGLRVDVHSRRGTSAGP